MASLFEALAELQIKLMHSLDQAYDLKGLTKSERGKIERVIGELTQYLLMSRDDLALKILFNKFSRSDYDGEVAASRQEMQAALGAAQGIDLGCDLDMNSPEDNLKRIQALTQEKMGRVGGMSRRHLAGVIRRMAYIRRKARKTAFPPYLAVFKDAGKDACATGKVA